MHPAADREPYRVPRYVTEAGLEAFHREVKAYARKLSIELDHRAENDQHDGQPEQTADVVRETANGVDRTGRRRPGVAVVIATICITIATLGPPIIAGLTSPSAVMIWTSWGFLAFAVVGVALLWFTRAGRSRSPR
jgi:hypothetical protein